MKTRKKTARPKNSVGTRAAQRDGRPKKSRGGGSGGQTGSGYEGEGLGCMELVEGRTFVESVKEAAARSLAEKNSGRGEMWGRRVLVLQGWRRGD